MFKLEASNQYIEDYIKLAKNNTKLQKRIYKALQLLESNPFHNSLRTHKVKNYFSSWVEGDARIIWEYSEQKEIILLLMIGRHTGSLKVY
jgi:mRNA-degrading endonuclease YafQ of YafQ-DinJ toxin-antitoxin module